MTLSLRSDPQLATLIGAPHHQEVPMPYSAAATLAGAGDLSSWCAAIVRMSETDLAAGIITPFYQPAL